MSESRHTSSARTTRHGVGLFVVYLLAHLLLCLPHQHDVTVPVAASVTISGSVAHCSGHYDTSHGGIDQNGAGQDRSDHPGPQAPECVSHDDRQATADSGWGRYPDLAETVHSGTADFSEGAVSGSPAHRFVRRADSGRVLLFSLGVSRT